jgi:hypothetical protein
MFCELWNRRAHRVAAGLFEHWKSWCA